MIVDQNYLSEHPEEKTEPEPCEQEPSAQPEVPEIKLRKWYKILESKAKTEENSCYKLDLIASDRDPEFLQLLSKVGDHQNQPTSAT